MDKSRVEAAAHALPGVSDETLWQTHKMVAVGRLSGGVAHEFNNLMQAVVASLELIRKLVRDGRAAETEQYIAKAITSAQNASLLNERVARFARPGPIAPKALSINTAITDVEDLLRYSLPSAVKLEVTLAARLWTVYCDAGQAQIAIITMVQNARDAMGERGTIALTTRNEERAPVCSASSAGYAERHCVCIAVRATSGKPSESSDRGLAPESPADTEEPHVALDTVDRFVRLYGGELRHCHDAPRSSATEMSLPRYTVP